jgi:hypothetical protein
MQTQVSVSRVIKMTLLGVLLLFAYMVASAKPAHAHGGGDIGRAFLGVLGAATAIAIVYRVAYGRGYMPAPMVYAPQPYVVVQPQPVYVVQPPPPVLCRYTAVDIYTADGQYLGRETRQICR